MDWAIICFTMWFGGLLMGFAFGQWFGSRSNINVSLTPQEPDWDYELQDAMRDHAIAGAACHKPGTLLQ